MLLLILQFKVGISINKSTGYVDQMDLCYQGVAHLTFSHTLRLDISLAVVKRSNPYIKS